jgi:hypothetical protein
MKVTHEDGQKSRGDGAAAMGSMSIAMKMDVKPEGWFCVYLPEHDINNWDDFL